jgi:hypothetical protein
MWSVVLGSVHAGWYDVCEKSLDLSPIMPSSATTLPTFHFHQCCYHYHPFLLIKVKDILPTLRITLFLPAFLQHFWYWLTIYTVWVKTNPVQKHTIISISIILFVTSLNANYVNGVSMVITVTVGKCKYQQVWLHFHSPDLPFSWEVYWNIRESHGQLEGWDATLTRPVRWWPDFEHVSIDYEARRDRLLPLSR